MIALPSLCSLFLVPIPIPVGVLCADSLITVNVFGPIVFSCILIARLNASLPLPFPWRVGSQIHVPKDALICRARWNAWIICQNLTVRCSHARFVLGCAMHCLCLYCQPELTSPAADALLQQFRLQLRKTWVDRFTHMQARPLQNDV